MQWGDADEGSGFPGRMPEHDAEDDYEELLQVGQMRNWLDTMHAEHRCIWCRSCI